MANPNRRENSVSVLHVDDEPDFSETTAAFLERENKRFEVETARDANEGLDLLAAEEYDCIISDFDMPHIDGLDFLTAVREEYSDLPFILFTGRGSEEIASDAISAGVTDYLRKGTSTDQYELLANRITNAVDQVRTEQQLNAERQRFQILFDHLSQATVEVEYQDDEPIIKRVNPAFEDTFGYNADDLVGNSLDTYIVPESRTDEATNINRRVQTGASIDSEEVTRETADGLCDFLLQNAVYDDNSGGFAIYTDITERKERERELERQNTRLQALFEHFPEPTASYTYRSSTPQVTDVNEAFVDTFGYEEGTALGKNIDELVVPPDRREEAQRIDDRVRAGELIDEDLRRQTADGFGEFRFRNIRLPEDEDIDGYGVYQDITAYKNRERELERQNELFRKAQDLASVGAWEYDTTTDELTWSAQVYEIYGLSQEMKVTLEEALDFYHPDDRPAIRDRLRAAIEDGEQYDIEVRIIASDEELRWVRTRGDPQVEGGSVVRVRGTIQDITDLKKREADLQRERDRLDEFAGIVTHDLRNPLNVVEGRLELAREESDSEHLEQIDTAIGRINRIIDDMLWLAREGRDIGSTEPVEIRSAVESAWNLVADNTDGAELQYVADTNELPTIRADRDRMRQLLENLLQNAVEHGGNDVTITVGALDNGFYIEDDGPGIPEDRRNNVFDTGYSTSEDGTGLGLIIVKQVAQGHSWDVRVTDGSEGGARFEITGVEFGAA